MFTVFKNINQWTSYQTAFLYLAESSFSLNAVKCSWMQRLWVEHRLLLWCVLFKKLILWFFNFSNFINRFLIKISRSGVLRNFLSSDLLRWLNDVRLGGWLADICELWTVRWTRSELNTHPLFSSALAYCDIMETK